MEGGALFNSGFLGASFNWWVGQIADDSTWRDNILPGKFENANQIPGWGRRYKVRIIGLHDQGETEIKSDQLPWAQVMYPITGGGGQGGSGQTPNLRQGNMVFGFFLDGQEQQVPVIMGVLGNNAQTKLATKTGDGRVTNTQPGSLATSGFAEGQVPYVGKGPGSTKPRVPDDDKSTNKDQITKESADAINQQDAAATKRLTLYLEKTVLLSPCDPVGSSMKAMQTEIENLTKKIDAVLQTAQSSYVDAVSEVTSKVSDITSQVTNAVGSISGAAGALGQVGGIGGALGQVQGIVGQIGGATNQISGALGQVQGIAGSLGGLPGGIGAAAGALGGLSGGIGAAAGALGGAAGQVDDTQEKIQVLMEQYSPVLAKHMKVVTDKIGEYTSKKINEAIGPLADTMFPNQRFQFLDMKIEINEKLKCAFSKITDGLSSQILDALTKSLDTKNPSTGPSASKEELIGTVSDGSNQITNMFPSMIELVAGTLVTSLSAGVTIPAGTTILTVDIVNNTVTLSNIITSNTTSLRFLAESPTNLGPNSGKSLGTAPFVPICAVEQLTGDVIAANMGDIEKTVEDITKSMETFLNDIRGGLSVVGQIGDIAGQVGGIAGQIGGIAGGISGLVGGISGIAGGLSAIKIPNINGSITSALSFDNLPSDIFGCDEKPNCPVSDGYTLQEGGFAAPPVQLPLPGNIAKALENPLTKVTEAVIEPFAPISKVLGDLPAITSQVQDIVEGIGNVGDVISNITQ
jgi:hypothetical protein